MMYAIFKRGRSDEAVVRKLAPALAPLVVAMAYVRALGAPFVWDDRHLIVDAPNVTTLQPLATYFGSVFWRAPGSGDMRGYYRPLTILSFALDHAAHGDNAAGFHLTNVLFHATNVVLLYLVMRRWRVTTGVAFALAALWGLLPRLTEATAWISGRTDVLATTFVLAALLVYRPHRLVRVVVSSALVAIGLFAKEVALAGCVALVAMELVHAGVPLRKRWPVAAIPAALAVAFFTLRRLVLGPGVELHHRLAFGKRMVLAAASVGEYARMLAVPWWPELQIGMGVAPSHAMAALGVVVLGAVGAFAYFRRDLWLRSRTNVQPLVVLGSVIAASALALVLHLVPLAVNVVAADRFLYLPAAGIALALAPCVQTFHAKRAVKATIAAALVASFFAATFVRVGDWCSELDLWAKAYRETPKANALPLNELGTLYFRAGLFERAAAIYGRAVPNGVRDPKYVQANHANALDQLGRYDEAAAEIEMLCAVHTHIADACVSAAFVEMHQLRFDDARAHVRLALERTHGDYPEATQALAIVARAEAATAIGPPHDPVAAFQRAIAVGRRTDALRAGEAILADRRAPHAVRREAAEYWVRFGPPLDLARVLRAESASDVIDTAMIEAIALRATTAAELEAKWPSLGFGN
jgi:protein O-mannosyl-transferase